MVACDCRCVIMWAVLKRMESGNDTRGDEWLVRRKQKIRYTAFRKRGKEKRKRHNFVGYLDEDIHLAHTTGSL